MSQLGIAFTVAPTDVSEEVSGSPREVAAENARRKARAASGPLVLGADTLVALDGEIFGKPTDEAHAGVTLRRLAGATHTVWGGIALVRDGELSGAVGATAVTFRHLDDEEIERYVACGEWRGRAGGYAIQGRGAALVRRIEGDFLNVVGLPVPELIDLAPDLLPDG